jgi:hypothetical protein
LAFGDFDAPTQLESHFRYGHERTKRLKTVRLIDAHSFGWIFASLLRLAAEGALSHGGEGKDAGRVLGGWEKSIIAMRLVVENTVKNSYRQTVQRTVKNKELRMTSAELEKLIAVLARPSGQTLRAHRHTVSGPRPGLGNKNLLPSLDRIDSDGHYEPGNLQVVCYAGTPVSGDQWVFSTPAHDIHSLRHGCTGESGNDL